jgi:hypothetical protein
LPVIGVVHGDPHGRHHALGLGLVERGDVDAMAANEAMHALRVIGPDAGEFVVPVQVCADVGGGELGREVRGPQAPHR